MTEVTPHPLKTQGFHHFFILLFYDHPANDVTIMKEGHPEAGTPLFWWVRLELNQRCFRCHSFTDRCDRQLRALTHMAESAELESDITSDTIRLAGGPRAFRVHSPNMAGVAGLEPTNAGVRDRCLDHLATPQYIGRDSQSFRIALLLSHSVLSYEDTRRRTTTQYRIPNNAGSLRSLLRAREIHALTLFTLVS